MLYYRLAVWLMPIHDDRNYAMTWSTCTQRLLYLALASTTARTCYAQSASESPAATFDVAALVARAEASMQRVDECSQVSWVARRGGAEGPQLDIAVVETDEMARWTATLTVNDKPAELFRVVQREGAWYLWEFGEAVGKYRPYEAPLTVSTGYELILTAYPCYAIDTEMLRDAKVKSLVNGVLRLDVPANESDRALIRNGLALLDDAKQLLTSPDAIQKNTAQREALLHLLESGYPFTIDAETGLIIERKIGDATIRITDYRTADTVDADLFSIDGFEGPDRTIDPTSGDVEELFMIQHCGSWSPKNDTKAMDARLIHAESQELRRIPFEGAYAHGLCFSKDRRRVFVMGTHVDEESAFRLVEIDLSTGTNRELLTETKGEVIFTSAGVSNDGRWLATIGSRSLHADSVEAAIGGHFFVTDLETGDTKPVGEPRDINFVNWLPADDGWLVRLRENTLAGSAADRWICRMSLDGELTKIRRGDRPQLLPDGKTILFFKNDAKLWYLCDLDGGNERGLADGMPDYNFPAVAPDGKRMIIMNFRDARRPVPELVELGRRNGEPVTNLRGLWERPAWR